MNNNPWNHFLADSSVKVRSIDDRYLERSIEENTKPYFKFVAEAARAELMALQSPSVIEIGCATGAFLSYLQQMFPSAQLTGVDIHGGLVDRAKSLYPLISFTAGNICVRETLPSKKFDFAFMLTLHSMFDDPNSYLSNFLNLLQPAGKAYIFGLFNEHNVDVILRTRYADDPNGWMPGWNIFSKATYITALARLGWQCRFEDYRIESPIQKSDDPLKSWTVHDRDGGHVLINGCQIIQKFSLMVISA